MTRVIVLTHRVLSNEAVFALEGLHHCRPIIEPPGSKFKSAEGAVEFLKTSDSFHYFDFNSDLYQSLLLASQDPKSTEHIPAQYIDQVARGADFGLIHLYAIEQVREGKFSPRYRAYGKLLL